MAAEPSNHRSIAAGLAGSVAVLLIAAVGMSRARADTASVDHAGRIAPAATRHSPKPHAEWLRRLLSRSDLTTVEPAGRRG